VIQYCIKKTSDLAFSLDVNVDLNIANFETHSFAEPSLFVLDSQASKQNLNFTWLCRSSNIESHHLNSGIIPGPDTNIFFMTPQHIEMPV